MTSTFSSFLPLLAFFPLVLPPPARRALVPQFAQAILVIHRPAGACMIVRSGINIYCLPATCAFSAPRFGLLFIWLLPACALLSIGIGAFLCIAVLAFLR